MTIPRTDQQIIDRIRSVQETKRDWLGVEVADLADSLPVEQIRTLAGFTPPTDPGYAPEARDRETVVNRMRRYMVFALDKAGKHRGISASRSIAHYRAWTWLIGEYEAYNWELASQYGMPILRDICERHSFAFPIGEPWAQRMSRGELCVAGCQEGCGQ